jgi:hypothetical protein
MLWGHAVRPFNHPAEFAQTAARFSATVRSRRPDAALAQSLTTRVGVVATISIDDPGLPTRPTAYAANWRNRIDERQQLGDVVSVRAVQDRANGNAVCVDEDVVPGTGSSTIRAVRGSFSPAPTTRTDEESTAACERSISPASRSQWSSISCRGSHTPAFCQSCSRRQQVAPEPKPNMVGRSFHRRPVFSTNKMPFSAARSDMRGRPGCFLRRGLGAGSNGSINIHSSSSITGASILWVPL